VAAIRRWLVAHLAATLGTTAEAIDPREPFAGYGLDSLKAVALAGDLETWLGRRLPATLAYDYPTVEELARHLGGVASDAAADRSPTTRGTGDDEPIAITGIGCRLPMANDTEAFWRLLADGVDAVREVPPERWDAAAFTTPTPRAGQDEPRWAA
jgi:acyl carrier protein